MRLGPAAPTLFLLTSTLFFACGVDPPAAAPQSEGDGAGPPSGAHPGHDAAAPGPNDDAAPPEPLFAGAARVDATPIVGLPLGGYGARTRGKIDWLNLPLFSTSPATLFEPSTGVKDPLHCRSLVLARGETKVALVSLDTVGVGGHFLEKLVARAQAKGATLTLDEMIVFGSHTHSGPGAITRYKLFEYGAMDLFYEPAEDALAEACAAAIADAEASLSEAHLGTAVVSVPGVSANRRAGVSPTSSVDTVDTELGVLRVDRPTGEPVAVLWNYAIHGTALGPDNLEFSADVMGVANALIEASLPGVVALFANGAEGDISPRGEMNDTGTKLGEATLAARSSATLRATADLAITSHQVDFGVPKAMLPSETTGEIGFNLGGVTLTLGPDWLETTPRFSAVRIDDEVFVSIPGEAIYEIGERIKAFGQTRGFARTWLLGLANGHIGYITTPEEFDAGGYEAAMTFFGRNTGDLVIAECEKAITAVE